MLEDVNAGFHAAVLNRKGMNVGGGGQHAKLCGSRESNPDLLLGRQQC